MLKLRVDDATAIEASDEYNSLSLDPLQRQIIDELARVVAEHTGLDQMPARGFFWRALKIWQTNNRRPIRSMRKMTPEERRPAAREIAKIFVEIVSPFQPTDEERAHVSEALDLAFRYYWENYGMKED